VSADSALATRVLAAAGLLALLVLALLVLALLLLRGLAALLLALLARLVARPAGRLPQAALRSLAALLRVLLAAGGLAQPALRGLAARLLILLPLLLIAHATLRLSAVLVLLVLLLLTILVLPLSHDFSFWKLRWRRPSAAAPIQCKNGQAPRMSDAGAHPVGRCLRSAPGPAVASYGGAAVPLAAHLPPGS